jgi:putative MATE family efflux protein
VLLHLSWPVLVSAALHNLFNLINVFWVGKLGAAPLAAVTTSLFATWSLWAVAEMVGVGLVAVVARHVGAGNQEKADHAAAQGILLAVGLGVCVAFASSELPIWLFRQLATDPDVSREGVAFLRVLFLGSIAFFLLYTLESILRACGDTRTPMKISAIVVGLNLVLDPVLIFGLGPFPRLEVLGAAIATIIAHLCGVLLFLVVFYQRRRQFPGIVRNLIRVDTRVMVRLLRIGAPISLNTILFSVVYLFLAREAAFIGTGALAALGVGNRVESISYMLAMSLSVAAATMVGQNLGADQHARARKTAHTVAGIGTGVCSSLGLVFFLFAGGIVRAFSTDPEVIASGTRFLRIIAISQPFMGLELALYGVFQGAGYTLVPMLLSSGVSALRIPLARLAVRTLQMRFLGIPWVIVLTAIARSLILLSIYRFGRWTESKVTD